MLPVMQEKVRKCQIIVLLAVYLVTHMSLIRARPIRMEGSAFDFQCMLSPSHVVSKRSKQRPDFA